MYGGFCMKNLALILSFLVLAIPACAATPDIIVRTTTKKVVNNTFPNTTYSSSNFSLTPYVSGNKVTTIYSNDGTTKYIISPRVRRQSRIRTGSDAELLGALLAGAGLATGRISLLANPNITTPQSAAAAFLDPYIININGNNYVLVKDSKDGNWTVDNILGAGDSRKDLFESLKKLESDGDSSKITANELKKAGIRFVYLNSDQSLALNDRNKDFDISKVKYIDMLNLRTALGNKNQDGTFGYFYVIVKEDRHNRAYPGRVTFENENELGKYIKK